MASPTQILHILLMLSSLGKIGEKLQGWGGGGAWEYGAWEPLLIVPTLLILSILGEDGEDRTTHGVCHLAWSLRNKMFDIW